MQKEIQYKDDVSADRQQRNYSKFIIVSHARSGSNLLLNSLNSHPNLVAEHEVFAAHNRQIGENFDPILNNLFSEKPENCKAVGCKIFYYHLNQDEWQQLGKIPNLKVIHLQRENSLKMVVSMKVAFKTSQWGMTDESERIDASQKQVYLDYDFLRNKFEDIKSWQDKIQQLFPSEEIANVFYQDLVTRHEATIESLFSFLGLPAIAVEKVKIKHKKQNPEPLSQLIQNYDELKTKFANTPWASYFDC